MMRGCGQDFWLNLLLFCIGLGSCHGVHVLLEETRAARGGA